MSGSLNKVFLLGNLTRDPELKHTSDGTSVANFSIAVNRSYKSGNEFKKEVSFFDIVVWGKSGENCNKYLSKGRPVLVEGRLQNQHWEQQDGQKRTKTQIVADNVQFLGSGKSNNDSASDDEADTGSDEGSFDVDEPVPF